MVAADFDSFLHDNLMMHSFSLESNEPKANYSLEKLLISFIMEFMARRLKLMLL